MDDRKSDLKDELLKETDTPKKNSCKNICRAMGIGPLGDPTITFVRKFRWTLQGTNLKEHVTKKVAFDFKAKTINFEAIEIIFKDDEDIQLHEWLERDLSNEKLTFTTYDGCGKPLYEYIFSNLTLLEDKSDFDYAISEECTRYVTVKYMDSQRKFLVEPTTEIKPKGYFWTMNLENDKVEYNIKIKNRPTVNIEEIEINYLSATTWIPGKAHWQDITIALDRQHDMIFLSQLIINLFPTMCLNMYSLGKTRKLETWNLKNCQLVSMNSNDDKYEITIKYQNVMYKSHGE